MKAGKVWGTTTTLFHRNNVEVHRIEVKGAGFCSRHLHAHKHNLFYVERGLLRVSVWKADYDLVDITMIGAGEMTSVAPGQFHKFEALFDTIAFEVYWLELDPADIVRSDVGGADGRPPLPEPNKHGINHSLG